MTTTTPMRRIAVGEGSAEPVLGLAIARSLYTGSELEFAFGVRRTDEGLSEIDLPGVRLLVSFPGRGVAKFSQPTRTCAMSTYQVQRAVESGRLRLDALVVVATPPQPDGTRSLGTVNGPMQSVVDAAPLLIVEEDINLPVIAGAASIPGNKPIAHVITHRPASYRALSRNADAVDDACAEYISTLLADEVTLQLGVGGPIEALGQFLRPRRNLRVVTGAIGATVRALHAQGNLDSHAAILGTALVGDPSLIGWAATKGLVRLGPSSQVHNPNWLKTLPRLHAVNVGISIDLAGNVNAEWAGQRRVSGPGGAPNFARGARLGAGAAIVAVRADRAGVLVEHIDRPTIPAIDTAYVVCERGIADLRGQSRRQRAERLTALLA